MLTRYRLCLEGLKNGVGTNGWLHPERIVSISAGSFGLNLHCLRERTAKVGVTGACVASRATTRVRPYVA